MAARPFAAALGFSVLLGCVPSAKEDPATLRAQVVETERAFARSMADRDLEAFRTFLSEDVFFFSGAVPLRGKTAVADGWKRYFEGPEAPFYWQPGTVEVLDSGDLAWSTGPVRNPDGEVIATFTSIWRRESPGTWRIVFDRGCEICPPTP